MRVCHKHLFEEKKNRKLKNVAQLDGYFNIQASGVATFM